MRKILATTLIIFVQSALATSTRTIDADYVKSSGSSAIKADFTKGSLVTSGGLLTDADMEDSVTTAWTTTGTVTSTKDVATNIQNGVQSYKVVSTTAWTWSQSPTTPTAKIGQDAEISVWVQTTATDVWLCEATQTVGSVANGCVQYTGGNTPQKLTIYPLFVSNTGIKLIGSSAATVYIDDAYLGDRRPSALGITTTPWTNAGVITIGAVTTAPTKGTAVTDRVMTSRIGQNLIAEYQYETNTTAGASAGSGDYLFTLPSSLTFDSSVINFYTGTNVAVGNPKSIVGYGRVSDSSTQIYNCAALAYDSTRFRLLCGYASSPQAFVSSALFQFQSGSAYGLSARINAPVTEYRGDNNAFTTKCDSYGCDTLFSGQVAASTGAISKLNYTGWLTGACTVASQVYTCPVLSGVFSLTPNCTATVVGGAVNGYVNFTEASSTPTSLVFTGRDGSGGLADRTFVIECQKQGTDYTNSKISQQIIQLRDVVTPVSYYVSSNFTASATTPINFDTKEFDERSLVTTSATAWKFTAPKDGTYAIAFYGYAGAVSETFFIYKNGSAYKPIAAQVSGVNASGDTLVKLVSGDYVDIRPSSSRTITGGVLSNGNATTIAISRVAN